MSWNPLDLPSQTGRTFVVTGATSGIGYFAAEQLAAAGAGVILASRSAARLTAADSAIRSRVPTADVRSVVVELGSKASVDRALAELADVPKLDGVFLNGGTMTMSRRAHTDDGLPLVLATHVAGHVRMVAGLLPSFVAAGAAGALPARIVHASTGFVSQRRYRLDDITRLPATGLGAYTKAKTATEVFAFELDRRLRRAGLPVLSLTARPGVGVDSKTPAREGVIPTAMRIEFNPYTPWAQGKDAAAWAGVRALTDPTLRGGELLAPENGRRGTPEPITAPPWTAAPTAAEADSVWRQLEQLAGVDVLIEPMRATRAAEGARIDLP